MSIVIFLFGAQISAQPVVVHGRVVERSGIPVAGAAVMSLPDSSRSVSDSAGRFILVARATPARLLVRRVGFRPADRVFRASGDGEPIEIALVPVEQSLAKVMISGTPLLGIETRISAAGMDIPALGFGDPFRSVALLPLAMQANDVSGGLHLAGAAADEVSFELDGHPIQTPRHFRGVLGAVSPDALAGTDVYVNHAPVEAEGRVGGLVRMRTRTPLSRHAGGAEVGLLTAGATDAADRALGPLGILVSARTTYFGLVDRLTPSGDGDRISDAVPAFHDVLAKVVTPEGPATGELLLFRNAERYSGSSATTASGGETMIGVRGRTDLGPLTLDTRVSLDQSAARRTRLSTEDLRIDARWLSGEVSGAGNALGARVYLGVRIDHRASQMRWNIQQPDAEISTNAPRHFAREDVLRLIGVTASIDRDLAGHIFGQISDRVYFGSGEPRHAPRVALSSYLGATTIIASGQRRYQFDADGFNDGETGRFRPVFLLGEPRSMDETAVTVRRDVDARGLRVAVGVTGFVRSFSDRPVPYNPTPTVARQTIDTVTYTELPFRRVDARSRGGSLIVAAGLSSVWFESSYTLSRSVQSGRTEWVRAAWDAMHQVHAIGAWEPRPQWHLSLAGQWRSGVPATPVIGRTFTALPVSPELAEPRLIFGPENSIRTPAMIRIDFALRHSWGTLQRFSWTLQAANVANRRNVVGYDWGRYREMLSSSGPVPVRAGLPLVPSFSINVRW